MNRMEKKIKTKNDENANAEESQVGDPVYFINHNLLSKHDNK